MNTAKLITRAYFLGALAGSAVHIITSAHKMGGHGVEAYATPFMIDGIAILGLHMRNEKYTDETNKIGFRTQCGAGAVSLAMNVYAAHNLFGILFGIGIVGLFIYSEWASGKIELRHNAEAAAKAKAEADAIAAKAAADAAAIKAAQDAIDAANAWMARCTHPTKCASEIQCNTKTDAAAKRAKTRARNARKAAAEAKVLEGMLNN